LTGIRNRTKKHLNYQKNQIMSMSPAQLVLKVYDYAILGCKLKDSRKVSKALIELISALKFEHGEISLGMFKLYQYCMDIVKKNQFDEVMEILSELRKTWLVVVKESQSPKKNIAKAL